jgi:hypothetical protein
MSKVLLASPVNLIKNYILFDWLEYISNLTYRMDYYLVDNSENVNFHRGLRNLGYNVDYVAPAGREARVYMAECNELMRKKVLLNNYDYLFLLECDIFPPYSIVEILLSHQKPVVGAAYWTGHGNDTRMQLCTIEQIGYMNYLNRELTLDEAFSFMDGNCKPIYANGNGCILIHREILKLIHFHIEPDQIGFADSFFHADLVNLHILNWVDTSIQLMHYNHDWNIVVDNLDHAKMEHQI